MGAMKPLIWGITALLAAGWTGLVWLTHAISGWLLGAVDTGALKDAGGALGRTPLPPLPDWLAPWIDIGWLTDWQAFGSGLLAWLDGVLPSGQALMTWVGPLLWLGWGVGLLTLLALALAGHVLVGRSNGLVARWTARRT
jgi:hypothetical protein